MYPGLVDGPEGFATGGTGLGLGLGFVLGAGLVLGAVGRDGRVLGLAAGDEGRVTGDEGRVTGDEGRAEEEGTDGFLWLAVAAGFLSVLSLDCASDLV